MRIAIGVVLRGGRLLAAADTANTEPFSAGVLRRDGVIIPFAAYDGKRWSRPLAGASRRLDGADRPSEPAVEMVGSGPGRGHVDGVAGQGVRGGAAPCEAHAT